MSRSSKRVCLVVALGIALAGCGESGEPPLVAEDVLQLNQKANQVLFGSEHWVTSEGIRRARIEADTAFFIDDNATVEIWGMTVIFFDAGGDTTSILKAREGEYNWYSQNMVAKRDVVVVNPKDGRRVETSVVHYDAVEDRIWGDQPTTIWEPAGSRVEGTAFQTDPRMERVELSAPHMVQPGPQPLREK